MFRNNKIALPFKIIIFQFAPLQPLLKNWDSNGLQASLVKNQIFK